MVDKKSLKVRRSCPHLLMCRSECLAGVGAVRGKFSSPLVAVLKSLALVGCAYIYGAPTFESLRPGFIDGPFRQLHDSVNVLLRDTKIDPDAPVDAITQTGNAFKRRIAGPVNPD
ncbi:hypothetical protein H2509_01440 [Stappia sp. F7233]|uniref:Uncharacterized protein n=1 Tax=Stappia albiluteola TaxID=2758565 RepID=A0A839A9R7_9HYPH|nr:hypothetical protein [Stappia albiluteola]MBA5775784.1 hypothetical protein [Stappia albiluteola]